MRKTIPNNARASGLVLIWMALFMFFGAVRPSPLPAQGPGEDTYRQSIETMAFLGDRSAGSAGSSEAAALIKKQFTDLGFETVGVQEYGLPIIRQGPSRLILPDNDIDIPLNPIRLNAISPISGPDKGIEGPLVYVGRGELSDFEGKTINRAIVMMEFDSGKNWVNAASLGAFGLIFIDRGKSPKAFFDEKMELTPLQFPCFWMPDIEARHLFGAFEDKAEGLIAGRAKITCRGQWEEAAAENIYCFIPGTDEDISEEMVLVEAFYDSAAYVYGQAPAADQACSLAALMELARGLKNNPPKRSVLLAATSGQAQALAGMRELIWALTAEPETLSDNKSELSDKMEEVEAGLDILESYQKDAPLDYEAQQRLREALSDRIKTEVNKISHSLMNLRLDRRAGNKKEHIKKLAEERLLLRRLGWRADFENLTSEEKAELSRLVPLAIQDQQLLLSDLNKRQRFLNSSLDLRKTVAAYDLAASVSLYLSSHGHGLGAFNQGWMYPLKPNINRVGPYSVIDKVLKEAAAEVEPALGLSGFFKDSLRPSRLRSWQSYFLDHPFLGGEVSSLAGVVGVTLATVYDGRTAWGTPWDRAEAVDYEYAARQKDLARGLIEKLIDAPKLMTGKSVRNGFTTIKGRAMFIRHGELFPDQPANGAVLASFQDPAIYYSMADASGVFYIKGAADRKHVENRLILEAYKFNPETGRIVWAVDKPSTGKNAYRLKIKRQYMETELVMFDCRQTTLFNLIEPRSFRYLTKIQILDGRTEATPLKYSYSRIDTLSSVLLSVFLEPGTHMKMTLSDSVLDKKMILLNSSPKHPEGTGYLVDRWPALYHTDLLAARDMWTLLGPRITKLEKHGIYDEKIRQLKNQGLAALDKAEKALTAKKYEQASEAATRSWALATRVYEQVETTQKDVLFGVLFYIALFVPFAFCMERFIFSYADIKKRLVAFIVILLLLIFVIYNVHPAFQLSYSPTVVILAFFIMGLSIIVSLIIFFRFEAEMARLQRQSSHLRAPEISHWQAFWASFLLGVNNLRRRPIRTILTCLTLVILTFTIMSFTTVKSMRQRGRIMFQAEAPYDGLLLKQINWIPLPPEARDILCCSVVEQGFPVPRVWFEGEDRTKPTIVPARRGDKVFEAQGMVGLTPEEKQVTGIDRILTGGRWFTPEDREAAILPARMASFLGIDPKNPQGSIFLWGVPFKVVGIFSGQEFSNFLDLDGEPLTPAIFPGETSMYLSEAELDAMESGQDVRSFQSRYQHIPGDQTIIIPARTLLAYNGKLKSLAIRPGPAIKPAQMAEDLVDRFKLPVFLGENDGTFIYHASNRLSYSGMPNIVIPILISVLIVLNTMIGSVHERKREIGIYTSVGLAPSHVSFLFIAESMAFAVISVVFGYLTAQVSAGLLSGTSLWSGLTVNYSSLAGVAAVILIFVVVLVSVIYPSKMASRIAIPDVSRSWSLPEAKGNTLEFTLPVLMKYKEARGLAGFVYSYFKGHQDVSHGAFSTGEMHFDFLLPDNGDEDESLPEVCFRFVSKVWLAPFDFGITQRAEIIFCPAYLDPGFLEIKLRLIREAGEANAWHRINKGFINKLRKHILIWRSLDDEAHQYYKTIGGSEAGH